MHVAVLEDDDDQRELLTLWLEAAGHRVTGWASVAAFRAGMARAEVDALLLDWRLPDGSGLDALTWLRRQAGWQVAVVVLTVEDREETVVQALQAGADDYVVKPAKRAELLARLGTAVRRASPGGVQVLRMGAYEADLSRHTLALQGQVLPMTQKEFDLAVVFLQNPGKLLSRDHLLNKVWGLHAEVDTRTVDTHVSRLRKKLRLDGSLGWRMGAVYGFGYRLDRSGEALAA